MCHPEIFTIIRETATEASDGGLRHGEGTAVVLAMHLASWHPTADLKIFFWDFSQVNYVPEGLEAIIFTSEGDMRQAINNLQSTHSGFGLINADNVFKVCDQPHPVVVRDLVQACLEANVDTAVAKVAGLWTQGFASVDVVSTLFKVVKGFDMAEYIKLEYIRVSNFRFSHPYVTKSFEIVTSAECSLKP